MATLDEMRLWMSGTDVPGLPTRAGVWDPLTPGPKKVDAAKVAARAKARGDGRVTRDSRFKLSVDGKDAVLLFGAHRDKRVSELAADAEGRSYLAWMKREHKEGQPFDEDLMMIVEDHIDSSPE